MKFYVLKKDMPGHAKGDILIHISMGKDKPGVYMWEINDNQYTLPSELIESQPDWFEECFPNWVQNEPCFYVSMNGMIIEDYFDRRKHSTLARYGNLFKSKEDAEIANEMIQRIFVPNND